MLTVTPEAVDYLALLLERHEVAPPQSVRLVFSAPGAIGLMLDEPRDEDDVVVTEDERPVLLLDPDMSIAMEGATLDAVESPEGERLVLATNAG